MDIEISPTEVLRCASSLETAAGQLNRADGPGHPGNAGFLLSDSINRFASRMQETSAQAAQGLTSTAEDLDASATLLRNVDEDSSGAAQALWSRIR